MAAVIYKSNIYINIKSLPKGKNFQSLNYLCDEIDQ